MLLARAVQGIVTVIFGVLTAAAQDFRPPAVPLIANNPYFSVWSMADRLTDDVPRHWTGTPQSMAGLVRIDGRSYRIIGNEPEEVPAMEQRQVEVLPTRTIYNFEAAGIGLTLIFMTPALHFQARSVVGGIFIPMIADQATWMKWAGRASATEKP